MLEIEWRISSIGRNKFLQVFIDRNIIIFNLLKQNGRYDVISIIINGREHSEMPANLYRKRILSNGTVVLHDGTMIYKTGKVRDKKGDIYYPNSSIREIFLEPNIADSLNKLSID